MNSNLTEASFSRLRPIRKPARMYCLLPESAIRHIQRRRCDRAMETKKPTRRFAQAVTAYQRSAQPLLHLRHFDDTRKTVMNQYVEQFSALGQEDRLEIFRLLVRAGPQGQCVDEIRRRRKMPGSTLPHHLDALPRCGLLTAQPPGRFIYYAVNWTKTAKLIRFMTEDCCADLPKTLVAAGNGPLPAWPQL